MNILNVVTLASIELHSQVLLHDTNRSELLVAVVENCAVNRQISIYPLY